MDIFNIDMLYMCVFVYLSVCVLKIIYVSDVFLIGKELFYKECNILFFVEISRLLIIIL